MAVEWSEEYATGLAWQDNEHKELFKAFKELGDAMSSGTGRVQVANTINFLADYVDRHFKGEEEAMDRHNYPDFESHKAAHDKFRGEISDLKLDLAEGKLTMVGIEVQDKLGDWLKGHIYKIDKQLGTYLQKKAA